MKSRWLSVMVLVQACGSDEPAPSGDHVVDTDDQIGETGSTTSATSDATMTGMSVGTTSASPGCEGPEIVFEEALPIDEVWSAGYGTSSALLVFVVWTDEGSELLPIDLSDPAAPHIGDPTALVSSERRSLDPVVIGVHEGTALVKESDGTQGWYRVTFDGEEASWTSPTYEIWSHEPRRVVFDDERALAMSFDDGGYCPDVVGFTGTCISVFESYLHEGSEIGIPELDSSFGGPARLAHRDGRLAVWAGEGSTIHVFDTSDPAAVVAFPAVDVPELAEPISDAAINGDWLAAVSGNAVVSVELHGDGFGAAHVVGTAVPSCSVALEHDTLHVVEDEIGRWRAFALPEAVPILDETELLFDSTLTIFDAGFAFTASRDGGFRVVRRCSAA